MQPISTTLLEAARSWCAEPVVQAIVEDRRIRWATFHDWPAGPDAGPVAQFSNGSIILRATCDEAGRLRVARVWQAAQANAWESWTTVASDARPGSDVAIAWMAPYSWLLLYEANTDRRVLARVSTDDGMSWSGATVLHAAGQTPWVAAWNAWAFVLEGRLHAYRWTGAAWEGPYTLWSAATPAPQGVAAYHDPGARWGHILYSSAGRLFKVELDTGASPPAYTTPRPLAPGGDQAASSVAAIVLPSLTRVLDLGLVATWVERHTGALAGWGLPVSAIARDDNAQHFGQLCPLAPATVATQRWHLAYDGVTKQLYAGNRRRIVRAPVFDADLRAWMRLGPLDVLTCRRVAERHEPGALHLELLDPQLRYRNVGARGSAAEAIKPLAAVRLRRGFRTAAGEETVDTPNYYVTSATLREGQGAGRLRIEAVDAFGLLALWGPSESLEWYGRSVGWLLEEICGRVGLRVGYAGAPNVGETLPHFSLHAHQNALAAVHALLRLARAVARPGANDTLCVSAYPPAQSSPVELGTKGELWQADYGRARHRHTHVRIVSEAHGVFAEAENVAASQAMGQRFSLTVEDNRVASGAMAGALAGHMLALAATWSRADRATLPLRPDLEVWDRVELDVDEAAVPPAARTRVLLRLVEEAAPTRGHCTSQLTLGELS